MCGRYTLRRAALVGSLFDAASLPGFEEFTERPRFNLAPSLELPVIRLNKTGGRAVGLVRWGLIPHWNKGKAKAQPINARAETLATSGMFKQAFARRRCLVPADGFYEWRRVDAKTKQPMFAHFPDDRLFGFAGVWERWRESEDAEPLDTFAIITTTPNKLMAEIHDRMPVILRPEDYQRWLDPETPLQDVEKMLKPYADGELEAVPVNRAVNSPRNDTPDCIEPLTSQ